MYHGSSKALCTAIASMARRIATVHVDPDCIRPLISCRLIPLSKNPGVRPIGVCETLRRIIGKAIMVVIGPEIQSVAGTAQLCARQRSGCEAAVHAMKKLYSGDSEGVLLVDATNAFNSLNRRVMLHNIQRLCPAFATCVINCYRSNAQLFVGGETLLSAEGTTQGDPLSMAIYALGTLPLVSHAKTADVTQAWFADDASAADKLIQLHKWWTVLAEVGPRYGYFVNAPKTWLVVKENLYEVAVSLFGSTGVQITTEGRPLLGGPLGTSQYTNDFIRKATEEWKVEIEELAKIARVDPQSAYAAYTHGQSNKWVYLARVVEDCHEHFGTLESALRDKLLPAICGHQASDIERDLFSLPCRFGGLGLYKPPAVAAEIYQAATNVTKPLVDLILRTADDANPPSFSSALDAQQQAARLNKQSWMARMKERAMTLKQGLPARSVTALSMRWADQPGASTWLTALPLTSHGFDLTRREFHDGLCLRYGWEPSNLPSSCSCGQRFGLEHALTCRRGGYVAMRHDEVRDLFSELLAETCSNVTTEPELQPLDGVSLQTRGANRQDGARLDIKAGGFWGRSRFEATFFDVRVFNPYAASYRSTPPDNIFASHDREKRRLYEERVREVEGACFTPLVFACTGAAGKTSHVFLKRLASLVSEKRNLTYAETMGWLRCRLAFALVRASVLCLRGTRVKDRPITACPSVALAEAQVDV